MRASFGLKSRVDPGTMEWKRKSHRAHKRAMLPFAWLLSEGAWVSRADAAHLLLFGHFNYSVMGWPAGVPQKNSGGACVTKMKNECVRFFLWGPKWTMSALNSTKVLMNQEVM